MPLTFTNIKTYLKGLHVHLQYPIVDPAAIVETYFVAQCQFSATTGLLNKLHRAT